jgi:magnesium-transporting ATPase (P-type)
MIAQVLVSGGYMGLVSFAVFALALRGGATPIEASNILLFLLVLFENVHIFNVRSETRSALSIPLWRNWYLLVAVLAAQILQFAAPFIAGLDQVLGVTPLALATWLPLAVVALTILPLMEAYKAITRRLDARQSRTTRQA